MLTDHSILTQFRHNECGPNSVIHKIWQVNDEKQKTMAYAAYDRVWMCLYELQYEYHKMDIAQSRSIQGQTVPYSIPKDIQLVNEMNKSLDEINSILIWSALQHD